MLTNEEVIELWQDYDKCQDFLPVLLRLLVERGVMKDTLVDISTSCPLLNRDKNKMYEPGADSLFAQSTTTRMEKAQKALKEVDLIWTEFKTPEKNVSSGMENKKENTLVNPTGPTPSL